jgi:hypothetical protein
MKSGTLFSIENRTAGPPLGAAAVSSELQAPAARVATTSAEKASRAWSMIRSAYAIVWTLRARIRNVEPRRRPRNMHLRTIAALIAAGTSTIGLYAACGGTEATPSSDAGVDAPTDTGADVAQGKDATSADASDAGKPCDIDADLSTVLTLPDASAIDAGGFDLGGCLSCLKTDCSSYIALCNADCTCKHGVVDFVACTAQNPSAFQTCGLQLYSQLQGTSAASIGQGLVICAGSKCAGVCTPKDGGTPPLVIEGSLHAQRPWPMPAAPIAMLHEVLPCALPQHFLCIYSAC